MPRLDKRPTTKITKFRRSKVFKRDSFICQYCKDYIGEDYQNWLTIDHKKPRILGGTNNLRNLLTACSKCNNKKSEMSYKLFLNLCQKNAI